MSMSFLCVLLLMVKHDLGLDWELPTADLCLVLLAGWSRKTPTDARSSEHLEYHEF